MSTQSLEAAEHTGTAPMGEDTDEQAHPQATHLHPIKSERPRLPEKEIRRRLWRIYEMALAAANRAHSPQGEDSH
jgi:hypothetical protein